MCFFDAEPCDFYNSTHHTARTTKPCQVCKWKIPPGAPYVKYAWKFDGEFGSSIICLGCELLLKDFGRRHDGGPTPDWFRRALRECFDGADKKDPDAKRWRDAMAEILRRGRTSEPANVSGPR